MKNIRILFIILILFNSTNLFCDIFPWAEFYGDKTNNAPWYYGVYGIITDFDFNNNDFLKKFYFDAFYGNINKSPYGYGLGTYKYEKRNKASLAFKIDTKDFDFISYSFKNAYWLDIDTMNFYKYLFSFDFNMNRFVGAYDFPINGWIFKSTPSILINQNNQYNLDYYIHAGLWKQLFNKLVLFTVLDTKYSIYSAFDQGTLPYYYLGVNEVYSKDYFVLSLGSDFVFKKLFSFSNNEDKDLSLFPTFGIVYKIGIYTDNNSFNWLDSTIELRSYLLPIENGKKVNDPSCMNFAFSIKNFQLNEYSFGIFLNLGLGYYQY